MTLKAADLPVPFRDSLSNNKLSLTLDPLKASCPGSVEFFSREGKRLGDKKLLERQVHKITEITVLAFQGVPLSQFRVDERLLWTENCQTTRKEDKVYSLLGIFDVYMPLIYGKWRECIKLVLGRDQQTLERVSIQCQFDI